jgi:hypothetical protein
MEKEVGFRSLEFAERTAAAYGALGTDFAA